jgi:ferrous iron transport protein A
MPEINRTTLDQLKAGERGVVRGYQGEEDLHYRLKELGLVSGTKILVKRFAPLGDPMEVVLRGYSLSIRKQDASKIIVQKDTYDNGR